MSTAPRYWNQVMDPQRCVDLEDFLNGVKYNEDALASSYSGTDLSLERRMKQIESTLQVLQRPTSYRPRGARLPQTNFRARDHVSASTQLVGSNPSLEKPRWPKDDSVVSRGNTPEQVNARPCRHCGSSKHWDYDCRHARQGARLVKVNFASPETGYTEAQEAYDALYYEDSEVDEPSDNPDVNVEDNSADQQDFCEPLQSATFSALHTN